MKFFAIELKISLLIMVIVASIIATGYLSYKNLSHIVYSIHKEARPDYKLIKIKEITADLADADNTVRLYSLTREPKYLKPYDKIISTVDTRMEELLSLQGNDTSQLANIRDLEVLIGEKLVVWDQLLRMHSKPVEKEIFKDFYSSIEKKTVDTIQTISVEEPKKNNILKRFFKKKKEEDEVKVPEKVTLASDEVQQEVEKLEKSLTDRSAQMAETESVLLKRNNDLTSRLQFLILKLEQRETESLFVKSLEAESLAQQTYRWLAIFCAASVLFLILVLFTIINYNRKASDSQRILHHAKMEAEKLVKAKELFTANVSHELRTPMNAIYGLTEQIMQKQMEPALREQLSVIKKSAEYLNKVVNDILDFSKIEAGKMSLENIPFSVRKILEEICMLNQVIADQKHLNFKCTYATPVPEQVMGDPTRLRQIILNLLNNAFKFTGQGEVTIEVRATYPDPATALIEIAVSDTGIGIAPEKLSNIFDDYSQADQSTTRRYGGTGLGLSIIKRLVELMNGSISVKSIMQAGTTFTCSIPFTITNTHVPLPENEFEVINIPDELKYISVLVADDEEYNRMLLSAIFKKWGIFFRCVSNGKEVVQYAREKQYDFILMDIHMPEINGYEASREILQHRPKSGIIALTAGNYANEIEKCKLSGMKGFLLKPFSEKELIITMLETLNKNTVPLSSQKNATTVIDNSENINLDELYRVSGGDEKFAEEMLRLFLKSTSEGITKLKQFYEEKDWNSIANTAHKMAPPCRHLGAMNLYRNLKELEKHENYPDNSLNVENLMQEVFSQASIVTSQVEQKIKPVDNG